MSERVPDVSEQRAERLPDKMVARMAAHEAFEAAAIRERVTIGEAINDVADAAVAAYISHSDPASVLAALLAESPEATVDAIEALLTSNEARETYWDSHDVLRYADTHEKVPGKPWDRRSSGHVKSACRSLPSKAPKEDGDA